MKYKYKVYAVEIPDQEEWQQVHQSELDELLGVMFELHGSIPCHDEIGETNEPASDFVGI